MNNMGSTQALQNAQIELEHIELELRYQRTCHLRHFIDQYYCYKNNYLTRNGRASWERIIWRGFVSIDAAQISSRKEVVKEHVVPIKVIANILLSQSESCILNTQEIASILDRYVVFATISKREDQLLRNAKLNSQMPAGFWEKGHDLYNDLFARYKVVGISGEYSSR